MTIFSKKEASSKIAKKISDLQAQLSTMEAQVSSKETEIEKAVSVGSVPDRLFAEAGNLKAKADTARAVLSKIEIEHATALEREDQTVRLAELARFEGLLKKGFSSLDSKFKDFVAAGKELLEKEALLGSEYRKLFAISAPPGVDFGGLLPVDFARIIWAMTTKSPVNTPERAIFTAERELASHLASNRGGLFARVAAARDAIQEDQTPAPPELIEAEVLRKPVIDGGKELYHRQRKEAIERLKASRSAGAEVVRDEEVRDEVAAMDEQADSAGRGHF